VHYLKFAVVGLAGISIIGAAAFVYLTAAQSSKTEEKPEDVKCSESFCGMPATPVLTPEEKRRALIVKRIHGPACFEACIRLEGSFVQYDHFQNPEERCLCVEESQGVFFFVYNYEDNADNVEFNIIPDY
jgi:hypothetical protein